MWENIWLVRLDVHLSTYETLFAPRQVGWPYVQNPVHLVTCISSFLLWCCHLILFPISVWLLLLSYGIYKILGRNKRSIRHFKNISSIWILYCALVRTYLEYASSRWNPYYNTHQPNRTSSTKISKIHCLQIELLSTL